MVLPIKIWTKELAFIATALFILVLTAFLLIIYVKKIS